MWLHRIASHACYRPTLQRLMSSKLITALPDQPRATAGVEAIARRPTGACRGRRRGSLCARRGCLSGSRSLSMPQQSWPRLCRCDSKVVIPIDPIYLDPCERKMAGSGLGLGDVHIPRGIAMTLARAAGIGKDMYVVVAAALWPACALVLTY